MFRFQHDRMCLSDISPERKGNGGESIYGPTFEGKSHIEYFYYLKYEKMHSLNVV